MDKYPRMRVSIVIPVYNEESYLQACLEAVAAQRRPFDEVIVVNNNSTDRSAAIAASFPFVTLISESRQGVLYARTTGYDAASGDIIARIDADTILPPTWSEQMLQIFEDTAIDAVSGRPDYYDVALPELYNGVEFIFRRHLARELQDRVFLYGANMAFRRPAWQQVRADCCRQGTMHEDFDLAIHLQQSGFYVVFDEDMVAGVSARRMDVSFWRFMHYVRMSPHTYARHAVPHYHGMYLVLIWALLGYLPGRVLHRGYDVASGKFSLRKVFIRRPTSGRIDPSLDRSGLT
jgi:glycosyltransferase involved in cell wall biosynthesis